MNTIIEINGKKYRALSPDEMREPDDFALRLREVKPEPTHPPIPEWDERFTRQQVWWFLGWTVWDATDRGRRIIADAARCAWVYRSANEDAKAILRSYGLNTAGDIQKRLTQHVADLFLEANGQVPF